MRLIRGVGSSSEAGLWCYLGSNSQITVHEAVVCLCHSNTCILEQETSYLNV